MVAFTILYALLWIFVDSMPNDETLLHVSRERDSVLLSCGGQHGQRNKWIHNDVVISYNNHVLNKFEGFYSLSTNYALLVESISFFHEGAYTCVRDSSNVSRHRLLIQVPPKLYLSYGNVILANVSYNADNGFETYSVGNSTYVAENKTISVTCLAEGAKPEANITWVINREVKHAAQVTNPNAKENRTFDSISTLQLSPTAEEINVTCHVRLVGTDMQASTHSTFLTYVKPRLYFLLNGGRIHFNEVYLRKGETVNITCLAEGSRPPVELTCEEKSDSLKLFSGNMGYRSKATFDTYLILSVSPESDTETITCRSSLIGMNITQTDVLNVRTYVSREPSITFNGKSHDTIQIYPNDSVALICNAAGTIPKANLTWKINGLSPHSPTFQVSRSSDLSTLLFQPKQNDMVECISYLDGPNVTRRADVRFYFKEKPYSFDYLTAVVPYVGVMLTILLVFCVCSAAGRLKRSRSSNLPETAVMHMKEMLDAAQSNIQRKESIGEANESHPKPPDLELPQIPTGSELPYYLDFSEQESDYERTFHSEYYSAMSRSGKSGKMFCEKDICFILNIKMGHIYDRWMGTIDVNSTKNKCVILSTVSENLRKREIQWHKFVKRAFELPPGPNLTQVEGIGIYEDKIYLMHEHVACDTLAERISDPFNTTEVMEHVIGVLEGLDIIQSFGLLHPGLSTKKVLLTKKGICKLYDFCITEDASNTVRIKKSRVTCTLNDWAPEALLRDTYNKASDVWSVAVVIWEILSCGSHPFPNEEQSLGSGKAVYDLPDVWPANYKLLRNERIFECWNQDTSSRPTTFELKSSFIEMFGSFDTYGHSNASTVNLTSSYAQMKGIERSEHDN